MDMVLVLRRKIISELMITYFPTLLLTAITFATTFFKSFFFEAALSVNLTTMLVMTTIFISKMESLPPTSDTKMIDIWLILCQIYPFLEVVLLTAIEYNRGGNGKKTKNKGGKKTKNLPTRSLMVAPVSEIEPNQDQRSGILSEKLFSLMEDKGANAEPGHARIKKLLADVVSRCKAPTLKTLGKLPIFFS